MCVFGSIHVFTEDGYMLRHTYICVHMVPHQCNVTFHLYQRSAEEAQMLAVHKQAAEHPPQPSASSGWLTADPG